MIDVKVLIVAQFQGEFDVIKPVFFDDDDCETYDVKGLDSQLYLNKKGVAGFVGGMGKANAASSLMTVLTDVQFNFQAAKIVSLGCGGGPRDRVKIGDVIVPSHLIDLDFGHHLLDEDLGNGEPHFVRFPSLDSSALIVLNDDLVKGVVNSSVLHLDFKASSHKVPVKVGTSVTSDNFWHGNFASSLADEVIQNYRDYPVPALSSAIIPDYLVSQMEDHAIAQVCQKLGLLDQLVILRGIVNFDSPKVGQTVTQSLEAPISDADFAKAMGNVTKVLKSYVPVSTSDTPTS